MERKRQGKRRWVLGVPVDPVTRREALVFVARLFDAGKPHDRRGALIATPNPEMVVAARRDPALMEALLGASLAAPDGIGLVWAAWLRGIPAPERVSGVDLADDIAGWAASRGAAVFLLGGAEGVAAAAAHELVHRHPGLRVVGAISGGRARADAAGRIHIDRRALDLIAASKPEILFVAFGHGLQEKWIAQNLPHMPSVRIAMGVGGTFDFLSGRARRAPNALRALGLEWLWRFVREPRRIGRIFTAIFVFPWLAITHRN